MQAYIKTMAWGFWRERRVHIACCVAIAGAFSVFMSEHYTLFERYDSVPLLKVFALFIEAFGLGGFIVLGCSAPSMRVDLPVHLSTKPVSSRMLVGIYLGLTILSVVVLHLTITLLYRLIGHVDWPILVPLIGLITFVLCAYAAYWSLSGSPALLGVAGIIIYALVFCWCREHLSTEKASWIYMLRHVLPYLIVIWTSAIMISICALHRARHGERLSSAPFWKRVCAWFERFVPGMNWKLKSPQKACFWILLRTRGFLFPVINVLGVIVALVMCALPHDSMLEVQGFMLGFAGMNLFVLPFFGMLIIASQGAKTVGLSDAIATRPLSNRCILGTIAQTFLVSYLAGWIVYGIGLVLICACFIARGAWESLSSSLIELKVNSPFSGPAVLIYGLGFWAAMGLAASLALAGRKWLVVTLCALLFVVPNVICFTEFFGGDTSRQWILGSLTWLFALGCILGSLGAFLRAYQRRLLPLLLAGCLIVAYLLSCALCISVRAFHINGPTETVLLCALLTLPFAPFATAPLALHWNRHR